MAHWLYPANTKLYDVLGAFAQGETYWPINSKIEVGDEVYLYLAAPHKQVAFACSIVETGIDESEIFEDVRSFIRVKGGPAPAAKPFMKLRVERTFPLAAGSPLSYESLKQNGLNGMLMGPRKLDNNPQLLAYIKGINNEL